MKDILIMERNSLKSASGFTLAEVLVTLVIIGVIAALTIPTLMNNTTKLEYVVALKKAYSGVNQALIQFASDKSCVGDLKCTGMFSSSVSIDSLGDELVRYFKTTENCKSASGCFPTTIKNNYDGSSVADTVSDGYFDGTYRFITADGMIILISTWANNCVTDPSVYSTGKTGQMAQVCGDMIIDVNGFKKPNTAGRDIFRFYITNGKGPQLYPIGGADDNSTAQWDSSCIGSVKSGYTCAARLIADGWEMKY